MIVKRRRFINSIYCRVFVFPAGRIALAGVVDAAGDGFGVCGGRVGVATGRWTFAGVVVVCAVAPEVVAGTSAEPFCKIC